MDIVKAYEQRRDLGRRQMVADLKAASAPAPSEPAGPAPVVGSVGVVGLRAESAAYLLGRWSAAAQSYRAGGEVSNAVANAFEICVEDLRRQMEAATVRQPEPNKTE